MKRTFVSRWIFPHLRTVSLPSRKKKKIESGAGGGWGTGWGQGQHLGLEYLAGSLEGHCGLPGLY